MKTFLKLFICLTAIIPSIGCWDRQEINDIAIVTGTSFDKIDENLYKVATQVPLPGEMSDAGGGGGGTSGGSTFYLDAGIGRNVREANAELQERMSRRLVFGHRRVAIFGEDLARSGIRKSLDVLTRTREARLTTQIFIAEGEAINVLSAKPQLERLSSEALREIGVNTFYLTLRDFLLDFQQKGNDPLLPVVALKENISPDPELVEQQVEVNKVAVFKRDQLDFITDKSQTSGIKWILEKKEGEAYTIEWEDEVNIVFRITEQGSNLSYRIENNKPVFEVSIEVYGSVIENETELNFEEVGTLERVNERISEEIKKETTAILEETFSRGIDSFGLGWLLHRRERDRWNSEWKDQWREMLPDLDFEIKVSSQIDLTGLVTEGIGVGE